MKCFAVVGTFLFSLTWVLPLWAQVKVQTIVPRQEVTVGNAFQVQYVVQDLQGFQTLQTPDFGADFRLVSGPSIYQGSITSQGHSIPIQNYSYTLVPLRKGKLMVQGATIVYSNEKLEAPTAFVTSTEAARPSKMQSNFVMHVPLFAQSPAQELEKSIRQYLQVTASVSRRTCYVGEPVVATFALFSKVLSASEVLKNPGFYGFSVVDIPGAEEQPETVENLNGNAYNKHLLRQVQLYPMQAGKLVIDAMTVLNTVELVDSVSGRHREKEMVLTSAPIDIDVKPLPLKGKPEGFSGAVGEFALEARLASDKVAIGAGGQLIVTLKGKGNFLQLNAPEVAWPAHVEGFEPAVTERLNKSGVPVAGSRQYQYNFTADSLGRYTLAPIAFDYFNPATQGYHTLTTDTLHFTVVPKNRLQAFFSNKRHAAATMDYKWGIALTVLAAAAVMLWVVRRKKAKASKTHNRQVAAAAALSYEAQLKAITTDEPAGKEAYHQLQQLLYGFLKETYAIQTSSKAHRQQQLQQAPLTAAQQSELNAILEECEVVLYYGAAPAQPFAALQQRAIAIVHQLEPAA